MNLEFKEIAAVHGVFGVLWVIMLFWFFTAVSAYVSSPSEERGIRLHVSGTVARVVGGIAIILGVTLSALAGELNASFKFDSTGGIILSIGIVIAFIAYAIVGEGIVMRLVRKISPDKSNDLKKFTTMEFGLAILALILMVVGSTI